MLALVRKSKAIIVRRWVPIKESKREHALKWSVRLGALSNFLTSKNASTSLHGHGTWPSTRHRQIVEVELIKNRLHYLSNRNHSCYSCFWFCGSYLFLSKSDTCLLLLLFYIYIYTHCISVFHPSLSLAHLLT